METVTDTVTLHRVCAVCKQEWDEQVAEEVLSAIQALPVTECSNCGYLIAD